MVENFNKDNSVEIQCPECGERYVVLKSFIKQPIKVKCAHCEYSWLYKYNENNEDDISNISQSNNHNLISEDHYENDDRGDFDYDEQDVIDAGKYENTSIPLNNDINNLLHQEEYNPIETDVVQDKNIDEEVNKDRDLDDLFADLDDDEDEDKGVDEYKDVKDKAEIIQDDNENYDNENYDEEYDIDDEEENIESKIEEEESLEDEEDLEEKRWSDEKDEEDKDSEEDYSKDLEDEDEDEDEDLDEEEEEEDDEDDLDEDDEEDGEDGEDGEDEDDLDEEEEEEEEEEKSLLEKLLNYGLIILSPIVICGLLISGGMNIYNALPNFMKSGLSIFGIQNLTGIQIINIKPKIIKNDEKSFNIIIDGTLVNLSDSEKNLPPVTIYIEDQNSKKYEYVMNLEKKSLKSMEYHKFNYKIFALEFEPAKIDVSLVSGMNKYVRYKN